MPNVMAGWDAWSPVLEGLTADQLRESILKMKPFMVNTIAADYQVHPRYNYVNDLTNYRQEQPVMRAVPMGQGMIDYKTWFETLRQIGYRGWIVYEMCEVLDGGGSIENLDKTARIFLEYMKQY
jgi:sugar phosphate isomerase/epimerase